MLGVKPEGGVRGNAGKKKKLWLGLLTTRG